MLSLGNFEIMTVLFVLAVGTALFLHRKNVTLAQELEKLSPTLEKDLTAVAPEVETAVAVAVPVLEVVDPVAVPVISAVGTVVSVATAPAPIQGNVSPTA